MKRISAKTLLYLVAISSMFCFPLPSQEQPKIHEKVEVVNLEVLVRVFDSQGNPVGGLKKEDFRILEGKEEIPINGFAEIRKKIASPAPANRRLFVLIYNIGDTRTELEKSVDVFFERICRSGDRVMVMTNHLVFHDHVVSDFAVEKEKIKNMLRLEIGSLKNRMLRMESKLRMLVEGMKNNIRGEFEKPRNPLGLPEADLRIDNESKMTWYNNFKQFYNQYLQIFRDYRDEYLLLDISQYARMSDYLKKQETEKYALVFFQQGVFPFFKTQSDLQVLTDKLINWLMIGDSFQQMMINQLFMDTQRELEAPSVVPEEGIAKLFLNSGATFHLLRMMPTFSRDLEDLQYQNVFIDAENTMEKLTNMTNGVLASFSKYESFLRQVEQRENIYYQLTYAPVDRVKPASLKVSVGDKKMSVVYDNQRQPQYVREILDRENAIPQVTINEMALSGTNLRLTIAGFRLPKPAGKTAPGKVDFRCRLWNGEYALVHDETRHIVAETESQGLTLSLPLLMPGNYEMILDVTDQLSGKNDLTVRDVIVDMSSAYRFAEQKEASAGIDDESACLKKEGKEAQDCFKRLADAYLDRDDVVSAAKYYERSGEKNRIAGFKRIGESLMGEGELERALQFLEKAEPSRVRCRAYGEQADRFLKKGKAALAKYYFQKAIKDFEVVSLSMNNDLDEDDKKVYQRWMDQLAGLKK